MVSFVNSQGTWTSATRRNKDKIENPGLVQQEQTKNRKHAELYAPIGFAFLALLYPALDLSGLLRFVVFSPLLILNRASRNLFSLDRTFRLWILQLVPSFAPYAIGRYQLASDMQLPRPLLCAYSEFLDFRCRPLSLAMH